MKLIAVFIFSLSVLIMNSQPATNQMSLIYPELLLSVNGVILPVNNNPKSATVSIISESPAEGQFKNGKIVFYYEKDKLVKKEVYNREDKLEEVSTFQYDKNGKLLIIIKKNEINHSEIQTNFTYDNKNILVSKSEGDVNVMAAPDQTSYYYDKEGLLTRFENFNSSAEFFYSNKLVIKKIATNLSDNYTETTTYQYDKKNVLISEETKNIRNIKYEYDTKGKFISINLNAFYQTTVYGKLNITYDNKNNITKFGVTDIIWQY